MQIPVNKLKKLKIAKPAWLRTTGRLKLKHVLIFDLALIFILAIVLLAGKAPAKVSDLSVSAATYDSAALKWSASEDAAGYNIYRSEDGKKYEHIGQAKDTAFTDTGLTTGTKYYYKVSAYKGIKNHIPGDDAAVEVTPSLETPQISVSTKKGKVSLKIDEVDGATGYAIYRDNEIIGEQAETSFVDEDAKEGKDHSYSVKAYRYDDDPVYSGESNVVKTKLLAVSDITAEIKGEDLHFSWDKSENYTSFKLLKDGETLTETNETEYVLEDFDPKSSYKMTLIGYMDDGKIQSPEKNQTFKIVEKEMTNEDAIDAACDWAVDIAEDDSFTYGEVPNALHYGCYFCGTNGVKGKGYEKTYICNALVHAAYSHGAGDKAMLAVCKKGSGLGMTKKSFSKYGNWKCVDKPSIGSLKKGDVLVANKDIGDSDLHHMAMYIGDGKIVQATRKGWSAESIATKGLSKDYYNRFDFVMRYTGTGSGTKYEVEDVTDN